MRAILLRVGCDTTDKGGRWNPPVDPTTWDYAYVPIPEGKQFHHICECPTYCRFEIAVRRFGLQLPKNLSATTLVHLDPDFESLSIGEPHYPARGLSSRGRILSQLEPGDQIAFYASFRPIRSYRDPLAYCLIGIFHVHAKTFVRDLPIEKRRLCAHGRRRGSEGDLVIWAEPSRSGRFAKAIPIGQYREGAYRIDPELLRQWGGLSVRSGYIQRSAIPPRFEEPDRFVVWLNGQAAASSLLHSN